MGRSSELGRTGLDASTGPSRSRTRGIGPIAWSRSVRTPEARDRLAAPACSLRSPSARRDDPMADRGPDASPGRAGRTASRLSFSRQPGQRPAGPSAGCFAPQRRQVFSADMVGLPIGRRARPFPREAPDGRCRGEVR